MGIKVDGIPGRMNQIYTFVNTAIVYQHIYGQCSELCGINHAFMPITIYLVDIHSFIVMYAVDLESVKRGSNAKETPTFIIKLLRREYGRYIATLNRIW